MRTLVLTVILALAALGTLGAPPAAEAQHWEAGLRLGASPAWRGGSHYLWRGGSRYFSPGGYYPGYYGGLYSGYYQPSISIGFGLYPYSGYDYAPSRLGSYLYTGYDYGFPTATPYSYTNPYYNTPPIVSIATPSYSVAPSVAAPSVMPPAREAVPILPADLAPARTDTNAHVRVVVPADAQVFFNGSPTRQVGEERRFVSPPLTPGQMYRYIIQARWTADGRAVDQTRTITVAAGEATLINFNVPEAAPDPEVLPQPIVPR